MPWGLLTFLIGLMYGYLSPGRADKSRMLVRGLWIGLLIALALGFFGFFFGVNPLGIEAGFISTFIAIAVLTLVFVLGVWLGDVIEGAVARRRERRAGRGSR